MQERAEASISVAESFAAPGVLPASVRADMSLLRRRYAGWTLALPVIALLAAGVWSLDATRQLFLSDMRRTGALLADQVMDTLEIQQVMLAALNARVRDLDWQTIRTDPEVLAFARALVTASRTIETFGLTSPDGHIALATESDRPPVDVDLSDRDFVAAFPAGTAQRRSFISVPVFSRVDGRPQVHLSRPRVPASGMADGGTVVAGFAPAVFERIFAAVAASPRTNLMLVRDDGAVLARFPVAVAAGGAGRIALPAAWLPALGAAPSAAPRVIASGFLPFAQHLTVVQRIGDWQLLLVEACDPALLWQRWLAMMAFPTLGAAAAMLLLAALRARVQRAAASEQARLRELAAAAEAAHTALIERSALESRLRQVEKTAALGQLAAGVAHDFNNLLQALLMGAETLQRIADNPKAVRETAATLLKVSGRGVALTRRMLDFARRDDGLVPAAPTFAPADCLRSAADLLDRTFGGSHAVRLHLPPEGLPPLACNRAEFETVVINLAVNARDAMPDGGEVVIRAAVAPPPSEGPRAEAAWLRLDVIDTGLGMDAATLAQAGEAFFTTKPPGRGTGLGLAMARGFAQRAGGRLDLASTPGEGTVATLWLPAG